MSSSQFDKAVDVVKSMPKVSKWFDIKHDSIPWVVDGARLFYFWLCPTFHLLSLHFPLYFQRLGWSCQANSSWSTQVLLSVSRALNCWSRIIFVAGQSLSLSSPSATLYWLLLLDWHHYLHSDSSKELLVMLTPLVQEWWVSRQIDPTALLSFKSESLLTHSLLLSPFFPFSDFTGKAKWWVIYKKRGSKDRSFQIFLTDNSFYQHLLPHSLFLRDAWKGVKGTSQDDAKKEYVQYLLEVSEWVEGALERSKG